MAMAAKKYADDYDTVLTTDERGQEKKKAVYHGEYYEVSLGEKQIITFQRNSLILAVTIIALHLGGGFVGNQGMYQFYVSLPYVFVFLPLYFVISSVLRIPREKRKYHRDEVGLSYKRMKNVSLALIILLSVVVIGEIVFLLIRDQAVENQSEIQFLGLEVIALVFTFLFYRFQGGVQVYQGEATIEKNIVENNSDNKKCMD